MRNGGGWPLLAYGWLSGCGSHEAEGNLIMRLVWSRALMGSGPREQPGNFCDGAVCSHTRSDSFILDPIWTALAWGHNYKVSTRERVPEINWSRYATGTWGSPLRPMSLCPRLGKTWATCILVWFCMPPVFICFPRGQRQHLRDPGMKSEEEGNCSEAGVRGRGKQGRIPGAVSHTFWKLGIRVRFCFFLNTQPC